MSGTVLCVANYAPDVGYAWWLMENFWKQVAREAAERGMAPMIAYPEDGTVPQRIQHAGIRTIVSPIPGNGLRELLASVRFVRKERVRLIYLTDRSFTSLKYLLLRVAGVKMIVTHDHTPGDRPRIRGLKGLLKAFVRRIPLMNCDMQLCVSPLMQRRAIDNAKIPSRRTLLVQNGINPLECSGLRDYAHQALGIAAENRICITVGRANHYKRIDFLIEVARRCRFDHGRKDLTFVHCGDGPDIERLKALASEAQLNGCFIFAGKRTDVRELLCSSDVALHAAYGEAFSLAVLEYMSAGLAVLLPDRPSVCQAVEHGVTGIVYRDGDAEQASRNLVSILDALELRQEMGSAASAVVKERYSLENMNAQFCDAISRALASV